MKLPLPEDPVLKVTVLVKAIIRIIYNKLINPANLFPWPLSLAHIALMIPKPRACRQFVGVTGTHRLVMHCLLSVIVTGSLFSFSTSFSSQKNFEVAGFSVSGRVVESQKVSCFPVVACCVRVCLLGLLPAPVCYLCEWVVGCVQCTYLCVFVPICMCVCVCVNLQAKFCVVEKLKCG